jgi:hypothetical protein
VLIALTEGEPDWDQTTGDFRWSQATPLPIALKTRFAAEPRWIDLRPYRDGSTPKGREFIALGADFAAAIRWIPKEDLHSEEVRQQRRARTLAGTAVMLLVLLLVAAGWQWQEARLQRNEALNSSEIMRAESCWPCKLDGRTWRRHHHTTSRRAGALAFESIEIARKSNRPIEIDGRRDR